MDAQQGSSQAREAAGRTADTARDAASRTSHAAREGASQTATDAKQEASHLGHQAASSASEVVDTTKKQVADVAGETVDQVRDLTSQVRGQVSEQAGLAARKLAQAVRSLAEELQQMSEHQGSNHGAATQAAGALAEQGNRLADYLENREPESVVSDLRGSAAHRSGTFLLGAVVAGALTGRLARGGKAASDSSGAAPPATTSRAGIRTPATRVEPTPAPVSPVPTTPGARLSPVGQPVVGVGEATTITDELR